MSDNPEFDKIDMDKICSGCLMYEQYLKNPNHYIRCVGNIIKDTGCPCIDCLVKMMCMEACEKLEEKKWPAKQRRYN